MTRGLIRLCLWVLRWCGWTPPLPRGVPDGTQRHLDRAHALVRRYEVEYAGRDGRAKRDRVLEQLIRDYPAERVRDLALALELAVSRELP